MALIGKIRERSGLVLLLVALAVAGFVIMDMTSAGPGNQGNIFKNPNQLGKVNGTTINRTDAERARSILYDNGEYASSSNTVWNFFVEKILIDAESKNLGMGVSKDELLDAQFSLDPANISPVVQSRFMDQTTGQINIQLLQQYKEAIANKDIQKNPEIAAYWAEQEKEIIKERLQTKVTNFVSKGCYTPKWLAEMTYNDQNTRLDATYVRLPLTSVQDAEAQVTDADFDNYIKENAAQYLRDREGRKMSYAAFNVVPLKEDTMRARRTVEEKLAGFRASKDSLFVLQNGGEFSDAFATKSTFTGSVVDSLFSRPIGAIVGPYINGGRYAISKILGRQVVPDSVKARHILFKGQTPKFIDSMFTALKDGKVSWDTLNVRYSTDKVSAAKGGDLGFFGSGMMVKPFNDLCFYKADQGKFYKVETQFGTHIVQVTAKKFVKNEQGVKLATISEPIEAGDETIQAFRDRANTLIQQNKDLISLKKAVEQLGMTFEPTVPLEQGDYFIGQLGGNSDTRSMVKWAYGAKLGEVSKQIFEVKGQDKSLKFVVAGLKSILAPGLPKAADVKEDVAEVVKNRKKAEVLKAKVGSNKDLAGLAAQYQAKIDTARQITFASNFIPNLGQEPKVIGQLFALEQGGVTEAIAGNGGVYVASVMAKNQAVAPTDLTQIKNQLNQTARGQVRGRLVQALKAKADIKDNREQ
jgi:peptidyl-prolyl cis-trans isomerase D